VFYADKEEEKQETFPPNLFKKNINNR